MKVITLIITFLAILLASCQKPEMAKTATIIGNVAVPGDDHGGVKVELQSASDENDIDIAMTEEDGSFVFQNVQEGFYYLNPSKKNYYWVRTFVGDNEPIHTHSIDKRIKVEADKIVKVRLVMSLSSSLSINQENLSILTPSLDQLDRLVINKGDGHVSFVLFNGTGRNLWYSLECGCFFAGWDPIYLFTSFNPSNGELAPGENVLITCYIDQRVYNATLYHYDVININFYLKLPILLNWEYY